MKTFFTVIAATCLVLCSAEIAQAKDIKKENQFIEAVGDKKLVSGDTWVIVSSDGKISGVGRDDAKIVGAWAWNKRFWCRNVVVNGNQLPQDCQKVSVDGNQVTFARNKGKGDAIVYTISE